MLELWLKMIYYVNCMRDNEWSWRILNEIAIGSLSEYLKAIEQLKTYYPTGMIVNNPVATHFLYRGLSDKDYKLLPGIFRKQFDTIDSQELNNEKYRTCETEIGILKAFIHEASSIISISSDNIGKWAEYAQHYGVPTRFLDWSKNPLVALYFCVRDNNEKDGSVWLLHAKNYHKYMVKKIGEQNDSGFKTPHMIVKELIEGSSNCKLPVLYTPYYVDARMSAQSSYFMVWGTQEEALEKILVSDDLKMQLPEKETGHREYGSHETEALTFRFLVHACDKQMILHELDTVGVNEKTLFPGLDGIGRYVERKYRFDYNEMLNNM